MKKVLLVFIIFFQLNTLFSQSNNQYFSFELRYPVAVGNNFISEGFEEGYTGIIDAGIGYTFLKDNNLGFGILLNSSFLHFSPTDVDLMVLSLKIKAEYQFKVENLLIVPELAVGYSMWKFRYEATNFDQHGNPLDKETTNVNYDGITIKGGTKVLLNSEKQLNWYLQVAYEFTKLEDPGYDPSKANYNRNIQLFYPGVGMIWKI